MGCHAGLPPGMRRAEARRDGAEAPSYALCLAAAESWLSP